MRATLTFVLPAVALRGAALWGSIHLLFLLVQLIAGGPVTRAPTVAVVLLTGALGLLDMQVRRERLLWANLGVSAAFLFATYVGIAVVAESLRAVGQR